MHRKRQRRATMGRRSHRTSWRRVPGHCAGESCLGSSPVADRLDRFLEDDVAAGGSKLLLGPGEDVYFAGSTPTRVCSPTQRAPLLRRVSMSIYGRWKVGLLASGSTNIRRLPNPSRVALFAPAAKPTNRERFAGATRISGNLSVLSPVTATGSRRIFTGFPNDLSLDSRDEWLINRPTGHAIRSALRAKGRTLPAHFGRSNLPEPGLWCQLATPLRNRKVCVRRGCDGRPGRDNEDPATNATTTKRGLRCRRRRRPRSLAPRPWLDRAHGRRRRRVACGHHDRARHRWKS